MPTFYMRAFDPAAETFERWTSTEYDVLGASYAGGPEFATLLNPHAAYVIADVETGGGDFLADTNAKVRASPVAEEAGAGNGRTSSTSDFGADVTSAGNTVASTELP